MSNSSISRSVEIKHRFFSGKIEDRLVPVSNFRKRYLEELNSYSRADLPSAESREAIYRKYVLEKVYNNTYTLLGLIRYIIQNINVSNEYFANPENKKFNAVICHGKITPDIFTVPKGVILCILTPLNRYAQFVENEEIELLNILSNPKERDSFLANPCCYGKDSIGHLFEYATVYFEGQNYFDIGLSINTNTPSNINNNGKQKTQPSEIERLYTGVYNNKNLENYLINKTANPNKSNFPSNINTLLKENMGVVVIKCCRLAIIITLIDILFRNYIVMNIL